MPKKRVLSEDALLQVQMITDNMEVMRKVGKRYFAMRAKLYRDALVEFEKAGIERVDALEILMRQGLVPFLNF